MQRRSLDKNYSPGAHPRPFPKGREKDKVYTYQIKLCTGVGLNLLFLCCKYYQYKSNHYNFVYQSESKPIDI
jgi:hypothetical protein